MYDPRLEPVVKARAISEAQVWDTGIKGNYTTNLKAMPWFSKTFNSHLYKNPNPTWGVRGLSLPYGLDGDKETIDPQFAIMDRLAGKNLRQMRQETKQGFYRPLGNIQKVHNWGSALWALTHELGHNNMITQNEGLADRYARDNLRSVARQVGLNRQQIRRIWRGNDGFKQ